MSASKVKFAPIDDGGKGRNAIPTDHAPNAIAMMAMSDGTARGPGDLAIIGNRQSGAIDEQFPTDALTKSSPQDELMTTKLSMSQAQVPAQPGAVALPVGTTPFGKLVAQDADFKWLQSKRDQEAEANFQQWFAQNFDFMSPEQKAAARELFPAFYEQRLRLLDKDLETMRELARIKITGITNRKDLMLTYAAESGFFDVNRLANLMNPEKALANQNVSTRKLRYTRGLLNPNRLPRSVQPPIVQGAAGRNANAGFSRKYNATAFRTRNNTAPPGHDLGVAGTGFSATTVGDYSAEALSNQNASMLAWM